MMKQAEWVNNYKKTMCLHLEFNQYLKNNLFKDIIILRDRVQGMNLLMLTKDCDKMLLADWLALKTQTKQLLRLLINHWTKRSLVTIPILFLLSKKMPV